MHMISDNEDPELWKKKRASWHISCQRQLSGHKLNWGKKSPKILDFQTCQTINLQFIPHEAMKHHYFPINKELYIMLKGNIMYTEPGMK